MRPDTEHAYKERVLRTLVYIQNHLDEAITLDELAAVAFFSPYHFHRVFRGMVGESVMEHVRRLRLERAAHRLKYTDQPVTRIAFDAGYETHEAFTRAFAALFGTPPSQFRAAHRTVPAAAAPSGVHYAPDGRLDDFQPFQSGGPPMDVRIETVPPMRVAFIRHVGPYIGVGPTWGRLFAWAGPRGLTRVPRMLGLCHDDPDVTPPDKLRYDACLVVDESVRPEGDVGVQDVGGGEYAVATHRGPYEALGQTYARLSGEWLPASGRELRSSPPFEVYLNSPQTTAPADLLTEIYLPLAAR
ncbi:MAG TPA: GyrI-like domain-containing protein [Gemmataceae bacterium]|jgi:AraC family transcriptional regulator